MKHLKQYILFFTIVLASQVLLFNNLTFSTYFAPLVYIVCIIMMPLGTPSLKMMIAAILIGGLMDLSMGTMGLNVIATLPVAYFRRPILSLTASYTDVDGDGDTPSPMRLTRFNNYVIAMVVLHNLIFFGFEHLTLANFGFIALRFLCSTLASTALVYLFIIIFTSKLIRR